MTRLLSGVGQKNFGTIEETEKSGWTIMQATSVSGDVIPTPMTIVWYLSGVPNDPALTPQVPPIFNRPAIHTGFEDLNSMRAYADRILAWWDRDRARPFNMKIEFANGAGPIIWAYATHTVELMRSVLHLSELDRMSVAAPQIRLMIELGMTAIWLYLLPLPAAKALIHETERQRRATVDDVVRTGHPEYKELLDRLDHEKDALAGDDLPEGKSFAARCKTIDGGLEMYVMWRMFSRMSHATVNVADHYLLDVPVTAENPVGLALNPRGDDDAHESSLGMAISMMLVALKVCDLIDHDGRRTTQLRRAEKRIGISLEFRLAHGEG